MLNILRTSIASDAVNAVNNYLPQIWCSKKLDTIKARASYVRKLFKSDKEDPFIWREFVEGDIQEHPEIGGYKMASRIPLCHFVS